MHQARRCRGGGYTITLLLVFIFSMLLMIAGMCLGLGYLEGADVAAEVDTTNASNLMIAGGSGLAVTLLGWGSCAFAWNPVTDNTGRCWFFGWMTGLLLIAFLCGYLGIQDHNSGAVITGLIFSVIVTALGAWGILDFKHAPCVKAVDSLLGLSDVKCPYCGGTGMTQQPIGYTCNRSWKNVVFRNMGNHCEHCNGRCYLTEAEEQFEIKLKEQEELWQKQLIELKKERKNYKNQFLKLRRQVEREMLLYNRRKAGELANSINSTRSPAEVLNELNKLNTR